MYNDFPYTPCPHTCTASSITNIPHQSRIYVTIYKPTLTHHYHSKSRVYLRVHSWCYTFYGFGQMYNDMYTLLQYHTEYFHFPKHLLCSVYSSLPQPQPLRTTDLFTVFLICLFQNVIQLESYSMECFLIDFFHLVICISGSSMSFHGLIAHFFLALNNIPLSGCITVYLFTY